MRYEVLLLGLLVGCVNYGFRYLPLRLKMGNTRPGKRGATGVLLDTIGIASICALLVVSTAPEVMHDASRFVPTLVGFAVLGASFYKTRSIIVPTLLSALAYGLAWKMLAIL
ncbi:L-valine transporter subunit YgaH [Citrobacter sp. Ct235]|uniref:L-valine transporter subunit YgaH n=1 Tax=Citrobacter sp. Ct235 TaxID=2985157 RepID=UPI0025789F25|nr:L-valine transporter subunit YgaH [Citrobacter sp. Ct235]MDM2735624.1 L-valine transporter subunit YgaH [Citrobacter sp. Ct235]